MREIDVKNAIIFCNRKKDVGIVHRSLLAPWLQCRRAAWGPGPASAHGDARRVPQRDDRLSCRERRGGARPRHPRREPHLQLRRADPSRRLHPPHRTDRPRGARRLRRHAGDAERLSRRSRRSKRCSSKRSRGSTARTAKRSRAKLQSPGRTAMAGTPRRPVDDGTNARKARARSVKRRTRSAAPLKAAITTRQRDERRRRAIQASASRRAEAYASPSALPPSARSQAPQQQQPARAKQQGMGDHVPAFMMRPVRVTSRAVFPEASATSSRRGLRSAGLSETDSPQPQALVWFGLLNTKPERMRSLR